MTNPPPDLFHLLRRAEHGATRRLTGALAAHGCTVERWRVLDLLAAGGGQPMTVLADHALLPAPSATTLIDGMVADNLVYRRPDPTDRRRVLVHITDRGRSLHAGTATTLAHLQADLLEAIGDNGELTNALTGLIEALATTGRHRPPARAAAPDQPVPGLST